MKKQRRQKKSRGINILLNILIVACAGVLVYSLYNIFIIQREYGKATGEYEQYQKQVTLHPEDLPTPGGEGGDAQAAEALLAQIRTLAAENENFIAWISIPGTNIEYPVVQAADNDYYLTHTFAGAYNTSGAIFLDYRNAADFSDANTIIYGHNMHNGTMFENLNLLLNSTTLAENNKIYIATTQEVRVYTIFSARQTDIEDVGYILFPADVAAFYSSLPNGGTLTEADTIITLSTCTYQAQSDFRVVVQARLEEIIPLA